MKKLLYTTLAISLLASTVCTATITTKPAWKKVAFEAGRYRVEVETGKDHHVSLLKVWISSKFVEVPKKDYQRISYPVLEKIAINDDGAPCLEIPVRVATPNGPRGPFKDGGSWFICFSDLKYAGIEAPNVR